MITIYGKDNCTFCEQSKALCGSKGVEFEYFSLGVDFERDEFIQEMSEIYGVTPRTMPQIVEGDSYIGGFEDLKKRLTQHPT
jgi:glutaredoxin